MEYLLSFYLFFRKYYDSYFLNYLQLANKSVNREEKPYLFIGEI